MFLDLPGSASGSVSHKYGSGSGSFHRQASLWLVIFDVNVPVFLIRIRRIRMFWASRIRIRIRSSKVRIVSGSVQKCHVSLTLDARYGVFTYGQFHHLWVLQGLLHAAWFGMDVGQLVPRPVEVGPKWRLWAGIPVLRVLSAICKPNVKNCNINNNNPLERIFPRTAAYTYKRAGQRYQINTNPKMLSFFSKLSVVTIVPNKSSCANCNFINTYFWAPRRFFHDFFREFFLANFNRSADLVLKLNSAQ